MIEIFNWADSHPALFTILALPVIVTACIIMLAVLGVEVWKKG